MRQISPGVPELWSDIKQTDRQSEITTLYIDIAIFLLVAIQIELFYALVAIFDGWASNSSFSCSICCRGINVYTIGKKYNEIVYNVSHGV